MSDSQDSKVLEFRLQRLRREPRFWTYLAAGFTAANGIFIATQQDIKLLTGFALPFAIPGPTPHLLLAAFLAGIAYASNKFDRLLLIPLTAYLVDLLFTAHAELWTWLTMHIVVLGFVGFSFLRIRALK